jgi:transcriptional regulator with XRE-family HTH domain
MAHAPLSEADLLRMKSRFAVRLKALRSETNMSQTEVAARAGITRRNLARIEGGEVFPRLDSLLRIQRALGRESIDALIAPTTSDLIEEDDGR